MGTDLELLPVLDGRCCYRARFRLRCKHSATVHFLTTIEAEGGQVAYGFCSTHAAWARHVEDFRSDEHSWRAHGGACGVEGADWVSEPVSMCIVPDDHTDDVWAEFDQAYAS